MLTSPYSTTTPIRSATPQHLRTYQQKALEALERAMLLNERPLGFLATGAGKTTILAELIRRNISPKRQRCLVFVHRGEIVDQIYERMVNQCSEFGPYTYLEGQGLVPTFGIVMADQSAEDARIVVASVQSLHPKRLAAILKHGAFDMLIIDEAHHYAAGNSYHKVLKTCQEANAAVKLVGFTATPKRHDKKALGHGFTCIPEGSTVTILDLIQTGFLVPVQAKTIHTQVHVADIPNSQGDFQQTRLVSALKMVNWKEIVLRAYQEQIEPEDRLTLAFFPSVDMSIEFVETARAAGISAAHIDGETDKDTRAAILNRFRAGEIRLLSNVGVFTEGTDIPQVSAILMAKLTRSEGLATQMFGRALRPHPASGKKDALIIMFGSDDSKVMDVGSLLGKMIQCGGCEREYFRGLPACPNCGWVPEKGTSRGNGGSRIEEEPITGEVVGLQEELVSIFKKLTASWHRGQDEWLSCGLGRDTGALVIAPPSFATNGNRLIQRLEEAALKVKTWGDKDPRSEIIKSKMRLLENELNRIDQYSLYWVQTDGNILYLKSGKVLSKLMMDADMEALALGEARNVKASADWRVGFASDKQRMMLDRMKVQYDPSTLNKGLASALIEHAINVPRVKRMLEATKLADPQAQVVAHA